MGLWIGIGLMAVVVWWLFLPRRRAAPAPEDDITTPIDSAELEAAERELKQDSRARPVDEADEEDDWGPGTV